jgi:hypothetical protein
MTTLPTDDYEPLVAWLQSHGLTRSCGPGAAISAFRRDLVFLLEQAAAGRREYAVSAPDASREVLEQQASDLDTVIRLVEGDMTAMTAWLPSWRWTAEMCSDLEVN